MIKLFVLSITLVIATLSWGKSVFSDENLELVLQKKTDGVVYLWSPFMPLSVIGREEIVEIADHLNLELISVLDPLALHFETPDPILKSDILMNFGMLNHYPAIALFSNGELIDDVIIHGYEKKKPLTKLIQSIFAGENE